MKKRKWSELCDEEEEVFLDVEEELKGGGSGRVKGNERRKNGVQRRLKFLRRIRKTFGKG